MSKIFLQQKSMNGMLREQIHYQTFSIYIKGTMDHPNEYRAQTKNWMEFLFELSQIFARTN
jgi:hypothetical protein